MNTKLVAMVLSVVLSTLSLGVGCAAPTDDDVSDDSAAIKGTVAQSTVRQIRSAFDAAKDEDFTVVDLDDAPLKLRNIVKAAMNGTDARFEGISTFTAGRLGKVFVVDLLVADVDGGAGASTENAADPFHVMFFFDKAGSVRAYAREESGTLAFYVPIMNADGSLAGAEPVQ